MFDPTNLVSKLLSFFLYVLRFFCSCLYSFSVFCFAFCLLLVFCPPRLPAEVLEHFVLSQDLFVLVLGHFVLSQDLSLKCWDTSHCPKTSLFKCWDTSHRPKTSHSSFGTHCTVSRLPAQVLGHFVLSQDPPLKRWDT